MTKTPVKIGLGAITRRRPEMLADLLESYVKMEVPEGTEVIVLIAENDETSRMKPIIDDWAATAPFPVRYALEPEPGIPFARNRALDLALEEGCDFLTFVDDDERVSSDWLVKLYATIADRGLDLVGGPLWYVAPEGATLSPQQSAVLEEVQRLSKRTAAERGSAAAKGGDGHYAIYTNNWICRLDTQRQSGLRFDEALRFSGGSDTKLYNDAVALGWKTGWSPEAWVVETRPLSRLSYRYFFERARDQEAARQRRADKPRSPLASFVNLLIAGLRGALYLLAAPLKGRSYVARAARITGRATGRFRASLGGDSALYDLKKID